MSVLGVTQSWWWWRRRRTFTFSAPLDQAATVLGQLEKGNKLLQLLQLPLVVVDVMANNKFDLIMLMDSEKDFVEFSSKSSSSGSMNYYFHLLSSFFFLFFFLASLDLLPFPVVVSLTPLHHGLWILFLFFVAYFL